MQTRQHKFINASMQTGLHLYQGYTYTTRQTRTFVKDSFFARHILVVLRATHACAQPATGASAKTPPPPHCTLHLLCVCVCASVCAHTQKMKSALDLSQKQMESFDAMATFREKELQRREVELDEKEVYVCGRVVYLRLHQWEQ